MKAMKQTLLALALAAAFTTANASPVDWTLSNVISANFVHPDIDQITLNGSFTFDADTNAFSNVNIVMLLSTDSLHPTSINSLTSASSANSIVFSYGSLSFASALSNAGGNVGLSGIQFSFSNLYRLNVGQSIIGVAQPTASAVPEPEAYAMMLAGLGLVGFAARRQSV